MVVTVIDADLKVWHQNVPGDPEDRPDPDVVVPDEALQSVEISERAEDWLDEASVQLELPTTDDYDLRLGDRIQFDAEISTGLEVSWTGRIEPSDRNRENCGRVGATLEADARDYVGSILKDRKVTNSWVGDDVGKVIRDIAVETASEIDATNIPDFGVETDQFFQQKDAWDAVAGLAAKADCILSQDGVELRADPIGELEYAFELAPQDWAFPWTTVTDNDNKNIVRVDSGVSRQEEQTQEDWDSFQRVTESSRITHRLRARKSEIHSVELVARRASDEDLTVRLQADEDGEPVEIDNTDSDIESASWDADNLPGGDDGDWQAWFFSDHTLPDRDPWLIIESEGSDGHDIAVNSDDEPAFRSFYPHPLTFEDSSAESIEEYGPREISIERDNLETIDAVSDAATAELAKRAWPSKTIEFDAASPRAHALEPGQIIDVDRPDEDAVGEFIIVEMSRTYSSQDPKLETHITANWRRGILAPQ